MEGSNTRVERHETAGFVATIQSILIEPVSAIASYDTD